MKFFDQAIDSTRTHTSMEEFLKLKLRLAQDHIDSMEFAVEKDHPHLRKASDLADMYELCQIIEHCLHDTKIDAEHFKNFVFMAGSVAKRINRKED